MANESYIHGKRKLITALIAYCGMLLSCSILVYFDKISDQVYSSGLTTSSLMVMAYLGANAAQKFSKGGGE